MISGFEDASRYYDGANLATGNGTPVSTWLDQSSGNFNLSAASALPTVQNPSLNGHRAVRWDGSSSPLQNAESLKLGCGFLVLRIDETATFSNFAGILTGLANVREQGVLVGNKDSNLFYNFEHNYPGTSLNAFEYRINDIIYPKTSLFAPVNAYKIIFFQFWVPVELDGLQVGKDRDQSGRLAKMRLALLALYENRLCADDVRAKSEALASHFNLQLAPVFPVIHDDDTEFRDVMAANQDYESDELIAETLGDLQIETDLRFSPRSNAELLKARSFIRSRYANSEFFINSHSVLPPESYHGIATSLVSHSGNPATRNKSFSFGFRGRLVANEIVTTPPVITVGVPSSPGVELIPV